jgi:aspartate kinase
VAASLLAVALGGLGRRAVVLDAREAGLRSTGRSGGAALTVLRPARLERLLVRGVIPVVTGFQGWHRGRLTTLGRGGSDITAVALADTLGAACELVKDPGALHTADPKLLPEARPIARATHRFVTELALAGARVIHPAAAARAEEDGVILRFTSLHGTGDPATEVGPAGAGADARAAVLSNGGELATVTVVSGAPYEAVHRAAEGVAARSGVRVLRMMRRPEATGFVVAPADGGRLLRTLHAALGAALTAGAAGERRYACQG